MDSNNKPSSSDEVDISQFFSWIGAAFSKMGNAIISSIAGLRQMFISYRIFFSITIISGLLIGISYSGFFERKLYTSSMIISCDYINMRVINNTVGKLNQLCHEGDRNGLAEVLNVDLPMAQNINSFSANSFYSENDRVEVRALKDQLKSVVIEEKQELADRIMEKIDTSYMQSFQISVRVYDPDIVKTLETALVTYFKNNDYVKKRIESNRVNLIAKRNRLIKDSNKLDSLKDVLYQNFQSMAKQPEKGSGSVVLSDKFLFDPVSLYKQSLLLNKQLLEVNEKLSINSDFEVVDGLTTFREPDNFSLPYVIAISLLASIVVGYILLGLWKFNKYLAKLDPAT